MTESLSTHLSDEELLRFVDWEMPSPQRARASGHLEHCVPCSRRKAALQKTSSLFAEVHEQGMRVHPETLFAARFSLKTRMADMRKQRQSWPLIARQAACAAIALLIVGAGIVSARALLQRGARLSQERAFALPRRTLTPGAVRAVRLEDLCKQQTLDNDPPVEASLQQAVFREYGLAASSGNTYALDYLIAPTLGGTSDIRNLWPQSDTSQWNARLKDQLENHLHTLVCQRGLDLATAQGEMANNWIAAYQRYFPAGGTVAGTRNAPVVATVRHTGKTFPRG